MSACVCVGGGGWQLELEEAPLLAGDEHVTLIFCYVNFQPALQNIIVLGDFFSSDQLSVSKARPPEFTSSLTCP